VDIGSCLQKMGILSMLRGLRKDDRQARILILGLDNAGKTTILRKLSDEKITNVMPTQGFNIKTIVQDGFRLNLWDIGGQQQVRQYWRNYFDGSDALVYVIDSADRRPTTESGVELAKLLDEKELLGVSLLIFANKQDLLTALTPQDLADAMQLQNIRDRPWHIQACSAKDGSGINEGLHWLLNSISKNKRQVTKQGEAKKAPEPAAKKDDTTKTPTTAAAAMPAAGTPVPMTASSSSSSLVSTTAAPASVSTTPSISAVAGAKPNG